jgi:hypothetical protein
MFEKHLEKARQGYYWTSFNPDATARRTIDWLNSTIKSDLEKLDEKRHGEYSGVFEKKALAWLNSLSSCMSSAITGGSNFNVAKAQKARNREQSAYEEMLSFRERYFKSINRVPTPSPEDELDSAIRELEQAKIRHEAMKEINKRIRKGEKWQDIVGEYEICEKDTAGLKYDGIFSYELSLSNARIKRLEDKVITMNNRIETKKTFEPIYFDGGYIDLDDDRVCIYHDEKPSDEERAKLRGNGFLWSPRNKRWQRKHTANALATAKRITGGKE